MELVQNLKGYRTIHAADQAGNPLCGRVGAAMVRITGDAPGCRWCQSLLSRPQHEHVAKMICAECGDPWPCAGRAAESSPSTCEATTKSGRACIRPCFYGKRAHPGPHLCRIHQT